MCYSQPHRTSFQAHNFEFQGPYFGPLAIIIGLPVVCYGLVYACNADGCISLQHSGLPGFPKGTELYSSRAILMVLGYFLFQVALQAVLPGQWAQGVQLPDGSRLSYKLTGLLNFLVTIGAAVFLGFYAQLLQLSWIYDNFVPLLTASIVYSFALSVYLYLTSHQKGALLAPHGNTGYRVYDFFMGRELNPRIGTFDWKEFCELYPGLIGWVLLDLGMAHKQLELLGYVTPAMCMVCMFHCLYVLDALWFEKAILTTMDITTDGFGFMLAFGDLTWVPFVYCLQARYLVDFPQELTYVGIGAIITLKGLGYLAFRGANSQKDQFRTDPSHPSVAKLSTLKTERGTSLIVSGWWGVARHINYLGDWLMAWSWCLPCGFRHIIPYFYVIYFGVLLVHRDRRDEQNCRRKYGKDWDKYCAIVKYRIIPLVY